MARFYDNISQELADFILEQHVFFVATARTDGRINLSPKGMDSLRILDANRVVWLNLTGSGNETAAHLQESNRITMMFCAFAGKPLIVRLYGSAVTCHLRDSQWNELIGLFPESPSARQIFDVHIDSVQTSCGYGVPEMEFVADRQMLATWAGKQGEERIRTYWKERNSVSIDGHDTGISQDH